MSDIPYVFDTVRNFNNSVANILLAKQVTGSWAAFATSGSPSSSWSTTIRGWKSAWPLGRENNLQDARIMVIGGGEQGLKIIRGSKDSLDRERLLDR